MLHTSSSYESFKEQRLTFKVFATAVSDILREMLQSIEKGHVPNDNNLKLFSSSLENLQEKYLSLQSSAAEFLGQKDILPSGCSVFALDEAINCQEIKIREWLREAEHTLIHFLSVESPLASHMEELWSHRESAQELLGQIRSNSICAEQAQDKITPYRLFLDAITMNGIDSEEKEELFIRIDDLFPKRVSRALYGGKYNFSDTAPQNFNTDNTETLHPTICAVPDSTVSSVAPCESPFEEDTASANRSSNSCFDQVLKTPDEGNEIEDPLDREDQGILLNVRPSLAGKELENLISRTFKNEYITLFQLFASFCILTQEQALEFGALRGNFGNKSGLRPSAALQFFIDKGCVKKLKEPIPCLVMPSGHIAAAKSVAKKKNTNLFALFQSKKFCENQVPEYIIRRSVALNQCMLRYLKWARENNQEVFVRILDSVMLSDTNQRVSVWWKSEERFCQLALDPRELNSEQSAWLLVPEEDTPRPILPSLAEGTICYAFMQGQIFLWDGGWKDKNGIVQQIPDASSSVIADTVMNLAKGTEENNAAPLDLRVEDSLTASVKDDLPNVSAEEESDVESLATKQMAAPCMSSLTTPSDKNTTIEKGQVRLPETENILADETIAATAARLADHPCPPSDAELQDLISRLLAHSTRTGEDSGLDPHLAQALMLGKAAKLQGLSGCSSLYKQLLLATACPIDSINYAGYNLNASFPNVNQAQSLALAAYIHALFAPLDGHDYALQDQANMYLREYEQYFFGYPKLKALFTMLCGMHDIAPYGFSTAVLAQLESGEEKKKSLNALQERAKKCMAEPSVKSRLHGIPELLSSHFGKKSDLYTCIEIVTLNKQQDRELVLGLLHDYYERSGDTFVRPNDKKIEETIDSAWNDAKKKQSTQRITLGHMARKQIRDAFNERLEIMRAWIESASSMDAEKVDRLRKLKNSILDELRNLQGQQANDTSVDYPKAVTYMLGYIQNRLENRVDCNNMFTDALRTGFVALDDSFLPVLQEEMCSVRYYEPWRRVLKHIACPDMTLAQAEKDMSGSTDSPMFDNLHQLELICKMQDREDNIRAVMKKAEHRAKEITTDFKDKLELAYADGRITEKDKEDLLQLIASNEEDFFNTGDFGCWKQFLDAMKQQKQEKIEHNKNKLLKDIAMRKQGGDASALLDKAEKHLADGQFAVAEEYINLYDRGDKEHSEDIKAVIDENDSFATFLSDSVFNPLHEYCVRIIKGRGLCKHGVDYIKAHTPSDWTKRHQEDSFRFIQNWPLRKGSPDTQHIKELIEGLGVTVQQVKKLPNYTEDVYSLKILPTPRDLTDYQHPIAAFGTELKSPLMLVVLYGSRQPRELVDTINGLMPNRNGFTIVLLDHALSKTSRCQLAEYCHQSTGFTPFLVIDRVLALHLALQQPTDRLPLMLSCTLPYATAIQPFVRAAGRTSDEMFCGRTRELSDILNPNGASLVYGGRQLGKTALLQRAQSRFHAPANKYFAVFCDIKNKANEKDLVQFLCAEVSKETGFQLTPCETMKHFCDQIDDLFRKKKVQGMLLLLDETDNFLKTVSSSDYAPVEELVNLKRKQAHFKFVLAGLNNVYRAKNATQHNGVFGQLGHPLCIKPLSPAEALRLILRPLRYLGFKPGQDAQLETILSNTNYYPGILQFFGYTLAQSLNDRYTRYYRASDGNPPFELKSEHLGSIMNSDDLNASIRDKFRLSLELDTRYFMLARCIGMLYHYQEPMFHNYKGYTVENIRDLSKEYDIYCLDELADDEYEALLDEMAEMGILHCSEAGVYRLRKRSFLDIIGSDMDKLDSEIRSENERSLS